MPDAKFIFKEFEIATADWESARKPLSVFEEKVIGFASLWQSGEKQFEFQTSGSTGIPGKIRFERYQLQASVSLTKQTFGLEKGQTALLCLDPDFIAGKMMIVRALEIGMNLHCVSPVANPLEDLPDQVIHFAAFVPYQLDAILKSKSTISKLKKIKTVIVGGSSTSQNLIEKMQTLPSQFFETFGMTETLTHIAIRKLNPPEQNFHALPGISISKGEQNRLCVKAQHLGPGIIYTNDIIELHDNGAFNIIGRIDNIINSGGVKISPEEVEKKISTIMSDNLNGIDYFIGGVQDEILGQRAMLFIESNEINEEFKNLLIELFRPILKRWEIPKNVVCVARFKRTDSGKVKRTESIHTVFEP